MAQNIDVQDLIDEFDELKSELENAEDEISSLEDELSDLEDELSDLEDEEGASLTEIETLRTRIFNLQGAVALLRKEFEAQEDRLSDIEGGGDIKYEGSWYPQTLIHEDNFTDYCKEMVEECGYISRDFPSWIEIDWDATAGNMMQDYSCVTVDGHDYYYRS